MQPNKQYVSQGGMPATVPPEIAKVLAAGVRRLPDFLLRRRLRSRESKLFTKKVQATL